MPSRRTRSRTSRPIFLSKALHAAPELLVPIGGVGSLHFEAVDDDEIVRTGLSMGKEVIHISMMMPDSCCFFQHGRVEIKDRSRGRAADRARARIAPRRARAIAILRSLELLRSFLPRKGRTAWK